MDGTSFYLPSLLDSSRHSATSSAGRNAPRTGRWVRYRLNETRPSQRNGAVESNVDTTLSPSETTTSSRHPHAANGWAAMPH